MGPLQAPWHAVDLPAAFRHQLRAIAGHSPPIALASGRNTTGLQQAMAHELGQPPGLGLIRLAPRHPLDMARIDQEDLHGAFEQVEHRLPVLARVVSQILLKGS
jgi:hypothetical protein